MASYKDYAPQNLDDENYDSLQQEIDTAGQHTEERRADPDTAFELPDKFKDKSPEEIARAYVELEKAYSRQGNDLGELRKTVDQIIKMQSGEGESTPDGSTQSEGKDEPLDLDTFYEDPDAAVTRKVEKVTKDRLGSLEEQIAEQNRQKAIEALEARYPGWQEKIQEPEFANWVSESSYRQRLVQQADQMDVEAADTVLGLYYDMKGLSGNDSPSDQSEQRDQQRQQQRREDLQAASLENPNADMPDFEEKFSRSEILKQKIAAKHGDADAQMWLTKNADAIAFAYEDGRITD